MESAAEVRSEERFLHSLAVGPSLRQMGSGLVTGHLLMFGGRGITGKCLLVLTGNLVLAVLTKEYPLRYSQEIVRGHEKIYSGVI